MARSHYGCRTGFAFSYQAFTPETDPGVVNLSVPCSAFEDFQLPISQASESLIIYLFGVTEDRMPPFR